MFVIKDLVVDMTNFYNKSTELWLKRKNLPPSPRKEIPQSKKDRAKLDGMYECYCAPAAAHSAPATSGIPRLISDPPLSSMLTVKELQRYQPTAVNISLKQSDDYRVLEDEDIFSADKEPRKLLPTMSKGASIWRINEAHEHKHDSRTAKGTSKWSKFITEDDENEELFADEVAWICKPKTREGASKWDNYTAEDDEELQLRRGREFGDDTFQLDDDGVFEATLHEQKVEEDVHPDFQLSLS